MSYYKQTHQLTNYTMMCTFDTQMGLYNDNYRDLLSLTQVS